MQVQAQLLYEQSIAAATKSGRRKADLRAGMQGWRTMVQSHGRAHKPGRRHMWPPPETMQAAASSPAESPAQPHHSFLDLGLQTMQGGTEL